MPMANPIACSGCARNLAEPPGTLCAGCKAKAQERKRETDRYRADDPVRKMYQTPAWKNFRLAVLQRNPICQRLVENWRTGFLEMEQCSNPATDIHHFKSPRVRPDLFTDWANVAALCTHCHHKNAGETDTSRYVPTVKLDGIAGYSQSANAIAGEQEMVGPNHRQRGIR